MFTDINVSILDPLILRLCLVKSIIQDSTYAYVAYMLYIFISYIAAWNTYEIALRAAGLNIKPIQNELVDRLWTQVEGRPEQPNTDINALPLEFAGKGLIVF